jgi:hypothetical protein
MKTVTLRIGDRLKLLVDAPFDAGLRRGQVVTIVGFNKGNSGGDLLGSCPLVEDAEGETWYTDLPQLFHYFKKENK